MSGAFSQLTLQAITDGSLLQQLLERPVKLHLRLAGDVRALI